jgi:hypothetical protein
MILGVRACIALSSITSRARQTHGTTEPWKSTWGAVSVLSADPFPQAASRTRRAPLEAPGAPQAPLVASW